MGAPRRRRRQRLQAALRRRRPEKKDAGQQAQGAAEGRQRALPRDRRGPRGRGHRLAPAARCFEPTVPVKRMVFHEITRAGDPAGGRQPARARPAPGRRPGDPPHPRPALRLRGLAGAVEEGHAEAVGGPGPERGDPDRRRAGAGPDALPRRRATGTSKATFADDRATPLPRHAGVARRPHASPPAGTSTPGRQPDRRGRRPRSTRPAARALADRLADAAFAVRSVETKPYRRSPVPAVHDVHAAAGGGPQAALLRASARCRSRSACTRTATSPTCVPTRRTCPRPALTAARDQVRAALRCRSTCRTAPHVRTRRSRTPRRRTRRSAPPATRSARPARSRRELDADELPPLRADLEAHRRVARWPTRAATSATVRLGATSTAGERRRVRRVRQVITFPGFLRAYVEGADDPDAELEDRERRLPPSPRATR